MKRGLSMRRVGEFTMIENCSLCGRTPLRSCCNEVVSQRALFGCNSLARTPKLSVKHDMRQLYHQLFPAQCGAHILVLHAESSDLCSQLPALRPHRISAFAMSRCRSGETSELLAQPGIAIELISANIALGHHN